MSNSCVRWNINAMENSERLSGGKRIVLSTFGSFGDIHPYIAIALELKARGHSPVIATSEVYREKMDAAGIEFFPVRPDVPSYDQPEEITKLASDLVDPTGGMEKVIHLFTRDLQVVYEDLNAGVEGADLLLTHPLPLVGPIVAQKRGLPWISSVLAPISFFSAYDPMVPPQFPALYHLLKLSPVVGRLFRKVAAHKLEKIMEPVYRLRAQLGLPRGNQPLLDGQHSPTLVLALFSSVFGKPQPDWPPNTRVTGFPFYDRRDYFDEVAPDPRLLEFLDDGEPPIVFTLGSSAFWLADNFYHDSIEAARALGRRALLLIGHERNRPRNLSKDVAAFEYAPFSEVFHRALAIVHSGGVGTTAQGLHAGRPVLVIPHAHDQFDNAARIVRQGCGRAIARPRYNAPTATRELKALLSSTDYFRNAAAVGRLVQSEHGAGVAADEIEKVLNKLAPREREYASSY
jgi:rhamnosyltransferase subunit B